MVLGTLTELPDYKKSMLDVTLETSFMKPIRAGSVKANFELGHKMEPIISGHFVNDCRLGRQSFFDVQAIFHVGLFQNKNKEFLRCTPDYLAILKIGNEYKAAIVEVKTRTTLSSIMTEEQYKLPFTYTKVTSDSAEFTTSIRKRSERLQLLHQATTMNIDLSILLIGDMKGRIMKGIWVEFPLSVIQNYEKCMDDVYEKSLTFFYRTKMQKRTIRETLHNYELDAIKESLKHQEYIDNIDVLFQEIDKWLAVHEKIRVDAHPLLPMKLCLHSLQGLWNRSKAGSDTSTEALRGAWFPPLA